MKIVIIDYEVGNIFNLSRAFEYLGAKTILSRDPEDIRSADKVILPGVGAFDAGIKSLKKFNLDTELKNFQKTGRPMLGICLGMQLLFDRSYEDGVHEGLRLVPGEVKKFPAPLDKSYKIPHMGWSQVEYKHQNNQANISQIMQTIFDKNPYFYFVHSYYVETNASHILLQGHYAGVDYAAGIKKDNILAFQFHPERSAEPGLELLKTFLQMESK